MYSPFTKITYIDLPPVALWSNFQGYLRCCLPGCSPHFAPNKAQLTTLMLCIFLSVSNRNNAVCGFIGKFVPSVRVALSHVAAVTFTTTCYLTGEKIPTQRCLIGWLVLNDALVLGFAIWWEVNVIWPLANFIVFNSVKGHPSRWIAKSHTI